MNAKITSITSTTYLPHILWITQFIAALITLALPPFFALFLPKAFPGTPSWFAAIAFAAPLACGAIMAPLWGKLADRYGRLPMLVRAHLGLAFALYFTASSTHAWEFLAGLVIQGSLGGTYAASRAFLLEKIPPSGRKAALEKLENAPRIALLIGPLLASALGESQLKPSLFFYLLPLPIFSVLLLLQIRNAPTAIAKPNKSSPSELPPCGAEFKLAKVALFTLFLGGGILAPFAVVWTLARVPHLPISWATFFALLPNLVFSAATIFTRPFDKLPWRLGPGLTAQALSMMLLVLFSTALSQFLSRLLYSVFFVMNWRAIHAWIIGKIPQHELGRRTGELDAIQRWASLCGGGIAAFLWWAMPSKLHLPLWAGALTLLAIGGITLLKKWRFYETYS